MEIKDCPLRKIISAEKDESVLNIAKLLKKHKERHIIITEKDKPIGIISTTDINNRLVAANKDPKKTKAEEIMTSSIISKDIGESLAKTYFEMLKKNIFSCPVTKDGKLKGVLDIKSAMNHIVKSKVEE